MKKHKKNKEKNLVHAIQCDLKGEYEKAELICQDILKHNPEKHEALQLLGSICIKTNRPQPAIDYITRATKLYPENYIYFYNLAIAFSQVNHINKSIENYLKSIELNNKCIDSYNNLGLLYEQMGKLEKACEIYKEGINNNKNVPPEILISLSNLYTNLGTALRKLGRAKEGIEYFQEAVKINPKNETAYNNMGNAFQDIGDMQSAIDYQKNAIKIKPNYAEAYSNLGNALCESGQFDEAVEVINKAIELNPNFVGSYINMGLVYVFQAKASKAIQFFQKALAINPNIVLIHNNLAGLYVDQGLLNKAIYHCKKALKLDPESESAYSNMGVAFSRQGQIEKSIKNLKKATEINPKYYDAQSNYLFTINYDEKQSPAQIASEHFRWGNQFDHFHQSHTGDYNKDDLDRPLNIGYVSPDFYQHSVAFFFEPVLEHHNKEKFNVFCYADNALLDNVSNRLQTMCYKWRTTCGVSDEQLVDLFIKDKIDILVDLTGHTAKNRLLAFARKPAPIQISYIGYPNTTGLKAIDYRITDDIADPPGEDDEYFTEKLIRLPGCFLCYKPPKDAPDPAPPAAIKNKYITFGSFNVPPKTNKTVISLWSKILKNVPGSRLILKSKGFACETVKKNFSEAFQLNGIDNNRISLISWIPSFQEHRAMYNKIDIALDTFPYNGTTTTCEALWMGTPVICLKGNRHAGRVGESLLSCLSLEDFICNDFHEYEQKAIQLANDIGFLSMIRKALRPIMASSPLCKAKEFTYRLERVYRKLWTGS